MPIVSDMVNVEPRPLVIVRLVTASMLPMEKAATVALLTVPVMTVYTEVFDISMLNEPLPNGRAAKPVSVALMNNSPGWVPDNAGTFMTR